MTIRDLLEALQRIPEDQLDQEIYVCDWCPTCDDNQADNLAITSLSRFDDQASPTEDNPLGINYCAWGLGCSGHTSQ